MSSLAGAYEAFHELVELPDALVGDDEESLASVAVAGDLAEVAAVDGCVMKRLAPDWSSGVNGLVCAGPAAGPEADETDEDLARALGAA